LIGDISTKIIEGGSKTRFTKPLSATPKANNAKNKAAYPMTCYESLSVIAYFLTFAATATYAWFAWGQWKEIRRQANSTESNLRSTERAWLAVHFDQPFQPIPDSISRVFFSIENTSRTLAKVKQVSFGYCLWKDYAVPRHIFTSKPTEDLPTIAVIYPRETMKWEARSPTPVRLSKENIEEMIAGETILDLHGQFWYDDIFDVRHYTRFCLTYHPRGNDGKGEFIFPTDPPADYNDAD
jgi:hypothetical protein